jgi:methylated-DNA-[protein]-cysteine S-methyltransferase
VRPDAGQNGWMASAVLDSPIGGLGVATDPTGVVDVSFGADPLAAGGTSSDQPDEAAAGLLEQALAELRGYLAGVLTEFTVPVHIRNGSAFDRDVWAAIATIPYGQTRSYGAIARQVGDPSAAQAVGLACHRNPVPLIVPCHRVVGSDGKLVGFGGGLHRKGWLLSLEARVDIERQFAG